MTFLNPCFRVSLIHQIKVPILLACLICDLGIVDNFSYAPFIIPEDAACPACAWIIFGSTIKVILDPLSWGRFHACWLILGLPSFSPLMVLLTLHLVDIVLFWSLKIIFAYMPSFVSSLLFYFVSFLCVNYIYCIHVFEAMRFPQSKQERHAIFSIQNVGTKYYLIRYHVKAMTIHLRHCSSNEQIANIFTKALEREKIEKFRMSLNSRTPTIKGGM